jgi:periplasmic protein TonB
MSGLGRAVSLLIAIAAHAAALGLLILLPMDAQPPAKLDLTNAVAVVFAPPPTPPPPPTAEPPSTPVAEPPPPPVEETPPPPPLPVVEPPPPAPVEAEVVTPPPEPPKPAVKPRPPPRPRPVQETRLPIPPAPPQPEAPSPPPQTASLPPAPPASVISSEYRSALSGWLQSHQRYPEGARQRNEQGQAILRFRVDRSGHVIDYGVAKSTGFADLDTALSEMMRGAQLPPFPASMPEAEIEVSVTIRFNLSR